VRYIVTVDRDAIDKGDLSAVVRVEDASTGLVNTCAAADLHGARIVSGTMRPDGAVVWIECEDVTTYA
jgi:hypothetical protein